MKWNLRLVAAKRGVWKASQLQQMLAEHGLRISAGKMSGLWSGQPASIKLSDLDVLCAVLDCGVEELLIAEHTGAGAEDPMPPRGISGRRRQEGTPACGSQHRQQDTRPGTEDCATTLDATPGTMGFSPVNLGGAEHGAARMACQAYVHAAALRR